MPACARRPDSSRRSFGSPTRPPTPNPAKDEADREIGITPPLNGSILRILEIPPESSRTAEQTAAIAAEMRRSEAAGEQQGLQRNLNARHHGMHRTESIDYALILKGEITMLLDDSETHLKEGDVVIMQGTYHSWANRGKEPCMMAFILIGAKVPWKK
jgi:mannose-6-phosphate isomerase-like protein (cupin superfamily)